MLCHIITINSWASCFIINVIMVIMLTKIRHFNLCVSYYRPSIIARLLLSYSSSERVSFQSTMFDYRRSFRSKCSRDYHVPASLVVTLLFHGLPGKRAGGLCSMYCCRTLGRLGFGPIV